MPTYSYRCSACNHTFEKVQRITEDPIRVCEKCGAESASRLITSGNFMLKGSGWYSDQYAGSSNKKAAPAGDTPAVAPAKPAGDGATAAVAAPATTTSTTPASAPSSTPSGSSSGTPSTPAN